MKYFFMYALLCCTPISLCAMEEESEEPRQTPCEMAEEQMRKIKGIASANVDEMWKNNQRFNDFFRLAQEVRFARLDGKSLNKNNELEELIKQGLDVNGEFLHEAAVRTLLYLTTWCSDTDNVRFLLTHGAAKSISLAPTGQDMTPLRWAAFNHDVAILKLFFGHAITIASSEQTALLEQVDELGSLPKYKETAATVKALINQYCEQQKNPAPKKDAHEQKAPTGARKEKDKRKKK